jgi:hypothetical protein
MRKWFNMGIASTNPLFFPQGFILKEEITLSATAQTVDFTTTLDGDNDTAYIIQANITNNDLTSVQYLMRVNGASATGYCTNLACVNATLSGGRVATPTMGVCHGAALSSFICYIFPKSTPVKSYHCMTAGTDGAGTTTRSDTEGFISTAANITSLGIDGIQVNKFGIGSVFRLFKYIH